MLKGKLFKNYDLKSWSFSEDSSAADKYQGYYWSGGFKIKEKNQATDWDQYIMANKLAGLEGTGYKVDTYKRGQGIKGAKVANWSKYKKQKINKQINEVLEAA
jgi:hypothetical protein|tara:strand:+ start:446 stop:754 length:309 start_codon:yes stop_codon:yes gene_type:complete